MLTKTKCNTIALPNEQQPRLSQRLSKNGYGQAHAHKTDPRPVALTQSQAKTTQGRHGHPGRSGGGRPQRSQSGAPTQAMR